MRKTLTLHLPHGVALVRSNLHNVNVSWGKVQEGTKSVILLCNFGGRDRVRTCDLVVANDIDSKLRRDAAIT
jgi:hypothetical protein